MNPPPPRTATAVAARPPGTRAYRPLAPAPAPANPNRFPPMAPQINQSNHPPATPQRIPSAQPHPNSSLYQPHPQRDVELAQVHHQPHHSQLQGFRNSPSPFPDSQSQQQATYYEGNQQVYYAQESQDERRHLNESYRHGLEHSAFPQAMSGPPPTPSSSGDRNAAPSSTNSSSGVLIPATQSASSTTSAHRNASQPAKVPVSEKVMAAVSQLESCVLQLANDVRGYGNSLHGVRVGVQALPTREEAKEEIRDIFTHALQDLFVNVTDAVRDMVTPISEATAQRVVEKVNELSLATGHQPQSARPAGDKATTPLIEHLVASLRPVDELKTAIQGIQHLPEALQSAAVFHRSMELLHHKFDKVQEPVVPMVMPQQPDLTNILSRIETRLAAMEKRLDATPSPGDLMATMKGISADMVTFRRDSAVMDATQLRLAQLANSAILLRQDTEKAQAARLEKSRREESSRAFNNAFSGGIAMFQPSYNGCNIPIDGPSATPNNFPSFSQRHGFLPAQTYGDPTPPRSGPLRTLPPQPETSGGQMLRRYESVRPHIISPQSERFSTETVYAHDTLGGPHHPSQPPANSSCKTTTPFTQPEELVAETLYTHHPHPHTFPTPATNPVSASDGAESTQIAPLVTFETSNTAQQLPASAPPKETQRTRAKARSKTKASGQTAKATKVVVKEVAVVAGHDVFGPVVEPTAAISTTATTTKAARSKTKKAGKELPTPASSDSATTADAQSTSSTTPKNKKRKAPAPEGPPDRKASRPNTRTTARASPLPNMPTVVEQPHESAEDYPRAASPTGWQRVHMTRGNTRRFSAIMPAPNPHSLGPPDIKPVLPRSPPSTNRLTSHEGASSSSSSQIEREVVDGDALIGLI